MKAITNRQHSQHLQKNNDDSHNNNGSASGGRNNVRGESEAVFQNEPVSIRSNSHDKHVKFTVPSPTLNPIMAPRESPFSQTFLLPDSAAEKDSNGKVPTAPSALRGPAIALRQSPNANILLNNNSNQHHQDGSGGSTTYRQRLGGYLHPRDMRKLVTPFSSSNEPELIVRRHVILLNFDPLRAIALRDRLLVIVPEGADSILLDLEKRVRGGVEELQKSIFGFTTSPTESKEVSTDQTSDDDNEDRDSDNEGEDNMDDEWDDFEGMAWIDLTFELQSVDAVLASVNKMLSDDASLLTNKVLDLLKCTSVNNKQGDFVQEKLRLVKDEVKEMESRVQGFVRAMNLVLDEDEDMALMNLSRLLTNPERYIQPVPQHILDEESDEPELILEAHLQQALSEVNALDLLKGKITNTEELVSLQMDTIRNRLLYINTLVTVISLCVAIGSFIGSIFGMNLTNGYETDRNAFQYVVYGTMLGCFFIMATLMYILRLAGSMSVSSSI